VNHCLLLRPGVEVADVERVYSHPQGLAQCRLWLSANLPRAALVESSSTAEAARQAHGDVHGAAIASELAAQLYELAIARRSIADAAQNVTRFLVIGEKQAEPTGRDRTSVLLELRDEPGILYRVLEPFARNGVNMSKIESRPSRRRPWEYVFFIDVDGHARDPAVASAIVEVGKSCTSLKTLGSYPRAESI
jgi:chorismate mutase/prephenate dehydratase